MESASNKRIKLTKPLSRLLRDFGKGDAKLKMQKPRQRLGSLYKTLDNGDDQMKLPMRYVVPVVLALIAFAVWRQYFDTLSFSELVGKQQNAKVSIFMNLFDFDTSLTRHDVARLQKRASYWERRIDEVNRIQDPAKWQVENEKLLAEMLEDPSIKKIAHKTLGISKDAFFGTIKAISAFK